MLHPQARAVVPHLARDAGDLPIAFQLLIYPGTDMRRTAPSHHTNAQGYLLTADTLDYFMGHYTTSRIRRTPWTCARRRCCATT